MIHDVDESLRALATRDALEGSRVEIAFDAPTREWAARQNTPTVSLYLYDIREDLSRREVAWEPVRGPDGLITEHRPPARRFRLSYLVTAWTQRPEDEHRLLSAMLSCFLRYPVLPADVLAGSLVEASAPLYVTVALPPPADRSLADVWSALGGELKPSLDVVVTAPMDVSVRIVAAPAVRESPRIRVVRPDGQADEAVAGSFAAGGRRALRRGSLSPMDSAVQMESVTVGGQPEAPPVSTAGAPARGRRGAKGGKDAALDAGQPATPAAPAATPGRRIVMRGIPRP